LDRVLGFAQRPEHPVCHRPQPGPLRFELRRAGLDPRHRHIPPGWLVIPHRPTAASRCDSRPAQSKEEIMATRIGEARITHPVVQFPDSLRALRGRSHAARGALRAETAMLVELRASQINGCSVCVEMHSRELKQAGAADDRIFAVAAWREAPYFTPAERA